jgi:hypothetical protein
VRLEAPFAVWLIRERLPGFGINKQKRSAQRFPPENTGILLTDGAALAEKAAGIVDRFADRLGRLRFRPGGTAQNHDRQWQAEESPHSHSYRRTALECGFVCVTADDFSFQAPIWTGKT